jgi:Late competence development protein ComFB
MLLSTQNAQAGTEAAIGSVHNYYERLVYEQLMRASNRAAQDNDFMADVLCVALNRLPPRYVRHDVDMTFFLSPMDQEEIDEKVAHAVNAALAYVESRSRRNE